MDNIQTNSGQHMAMENGRIPRDIETKHTYEQMLDKVWTNIWTTLNNILITYGHYRQNIDKLWTSEHAKTTECLDTVNTYGQIIDKSMDKINYNIWTTQEGERRQ